MIDLLYIFTSVRYSVGLLFREPRKIQVGVIYAFVSYMGRE